MGKSLKEIGRLVDSDKVVRHGYHRFYSLFLEKFRDKNISMLEIGFSKEKSVPFWSAYFPKAKIYGIDIKGEFEFPQGRFFLGDQSDVGFLRRVCEEIGEVDLIVDDGSHFPAHQVISFVELFSSLLKKGGVYIIEDIESSYWRKGNCYNNDFNFGFKHESSIVEIFKNVVDEVNSEFLKEDDVILSPIPKSVRAQIGLISFQHNCIIILKKDDSFSEYDNRKYLFEHHL